MLRRRVPEHPEKITAIPFRICPAKTFLRPDGLIVPGRTVLNHCQIVGEVARELVSRFPDYLQEAIFPLGSALAAAAHDIGKVSPTFVEKIRRACTAGTEHIPANPNLNPDLERQWGGHAGVSEVTAASICAPKYIPEILGQHHGFSPEVSYRLANAQVFGGQEWLSERLALLNELKTNLAMDWPEVLSVAQARAIAGLTSVSDWIGSGEFFENPDVPWEDNIKYALDAAGFIKPTYSEGLSFEAVFGFKPRSTQTALINNVDRPGVYLMEAPMGLGKTEAALYAAYQALANNRATGIYFALPTQLTSNKIFERFNSFLVSVLHEKCTHRSLLLHGGAWLLDTDMGEEGKPGGSWFSSPKRGLLAPFAVGTIDQALMAAMNVKHGFVRAFGLVGKVVILDEVHTYDAYTSELMDALVTLLRSLHCTVIILSATLNKSRRIKFFGDAVKSDAYPLITAAPLLGGLNEVAVDSNTSHCVHLYLSNDENRAIDEVLRRSEMGEHVLWIENTVKEAQQRYFDIAARAENLGIRCGLLHSRFISEDRQNIEQTWVNQFGKAGWGSRHLSGRILIGTQVLEQSLDIDADFIVSRFAPTDMLLQRLGRLWRHEQTPRPASARREAWILAPELEFATQNPEKHFGDSAFVYSPYILLRSLEIWSGLPSLMLPIDIRTMVDKTYVPRSEIDLMARWLKELEDGRNGRKGRQQLAQLARITLSDRGKTLPESKAQTRYSESENLEVLLVKYARIDRENKITTIKLLNNNVVKLPRSRNALSRLEWRKLTATLMKNVVAIRESDAPAAIDVETLKKFGFHHCFYLGNLDWQQDESIFRIAIVDELGNIGGLLGGEAHQQLTLNYRDDLGYRALKLK